MMLTHLDIILFGLHILNVMRTTITIDDDVLSAARSLARSKSESLGKAASELMRRGLKRSVESRVDLKTRFPVFKVAGDVRSVTMEDIQKAEDEAE